MTPLDRPAALTCPPRRPAGTVTRHNVGLFRNPAGLAGFSMDNYADQLITALRDVARGEPIAFASVQPRAASPLADALPHRIGRKLVAYWRRYPRYMSQAATTRFSANHVLDQAYGHLTYALPPHRTVVTCHDIFPLKLWRGAIRGMARRRTPPVTVLLSLAGLRRARFVIAPSQATRRDLTRFVGVEDERIQVIPSGVDPHFRPFSPEERRRTMARFPLGGEGVAHILCIDSGVPYKNQRAMVEVLARARRRSVRDIRLVHVGSPLPHGERARARRDGVEGAVIELGSLTRADIPIIYNRCQVLLFPSAYEGFGWPPLEAMACGLPVVTSRWPSIEEVVGDAALRADADDYDGLATHILDAIEHQGTALRLSEQGRARAAEFAWPRAARAIIDLYQRVIEESTA